MVELHRFSGESVHINPDLVKYIETTPDTVVTFVDGSKLIVRESAAAVCDFIQTYKRNIQTHSLSSVEA